MPIAYLRYVRRVPCSWTDHILRPCHVGEDASGDAAMKVKVLGVSQSSTCGVRDHAAVLGGALQMEGLTCHMSWLLRESSSFCATDAEFSAWLRSLDSGQGNPDTDAVLLHYSVFAYGYHGVPLFVPRVMTRLREIGLPVVTVLHELAFPWRRNGVQGTAWAATQRVGLVEVLRTAAALVVTTEAREEWLVSRPWLPRRDTRVAPVFSNLPQGGQALGDTGQPVLGMFGYAYPVGTVRLVLDALLILRRQGLAVRLHLLGSPGEASSVGGIWNTEARKRGLQGCLWFSGVQPARALANELASCDVLMFGDPNGPSSRKGTLAACLCSGTPVVALDGPDGWLPLVKSQSVMLVRANSQEVSFVIYRLLSDRRAAADLAERGMRFGETYMSPRNSAVIIAELLRKSAGK